MGRAVGVRSFNIFLVCERGLNEGTHGKPYIA